MRPLIPLFACIALTGTATAQIQSQRPVQPKAPPPAQPTPQVFKGHVIEAGPIAPRPRDGVPAGVLVAAPDRKGWISTIDGKRSGITFRIGSTHVIRGAGFKDTVGAWIVSSRFAPGSNRAESVGSMLEVVRQTDTMLLVKVTQIRGGKLPWSATAHRQSGVRLLIRSDGGEREFSVPLRDSHYRCRAGEPNCV